MLRVGLNADDTLSHLKWCFGTTVLTYPPIVPIYHLPKYHLKRSQLYANKSNLSKIV